MSITYDDIARENAVEDLYNEAKMERTRKEQCIYLFVEGESEEVAFPILLNELIDLTELGVIVANYNGIGNLVVSLKLLSKTLSHNRPVIITFDNDLAGIANTRKISIAKTKSNLFHLFPIPKKGIIKYINGHFGGSFEESFQPDDFINCAFSKKIIPKEIIDKRKLFENSFDIQRPWLKQLEKFCADNGYKSINIKKTALAERLALCVETIPETYTELAKLIVEVRSLYPVIHPDDVELPRISGLTI
jgi:hypothetical protein